MLRQLTPIGKAAIFSLIVLTLATALSLTPYATAFTYMMVPTVTTLVMIFVVTNDGYTKEGWKRLGLHRLGLRLWPFAILLPFLIDGIGFGVVLLTGLGTFGFTPEAAQTLGGINVAVVILVVLVKETLTSSLGEELGWRGYLLPLLQQLGAVKACFLSGLIWGAWHLPLMLFTNVYHAGMNPWLYYPLFMLTLLGVSFAIGYTRLRTESVWPAALMHTAANLAWAAYQWYYTGTSTVTEYVTGDAGVVQLVLYAVVAIWVVRQLNRRSRAQGLAA